MKKILFLLLALIPLISNAQIAFEETKEVSMSKDALFSKTKMFISDKWSNPKKSIQNEDKELGVIQVKTEKEFTINVGMGLSCVYKYEYLTKFRFKDNKYKIEFYDIQCKSAEQVGLGKSLEVPPIPYFEGENVPEKLKSMGKGISKKKAIDMMNELRTEFQLITKTYNEYINITDDF